MIKAHTQLNNDFHINLKTTCIVTVNLRFAGITIYLFVACNKKATTSVAMKRLCLCT
jgi:hypothetical protein